MILFIFFISCADDIEEDLEIQTVAKTSAKVFGSFGNNFNQVSPYYDNLLLLLETGTKKVYFSSIDELGNFLINDVPAGPTRNYAVVLLNYNYSFKSIMTFSRPSLEVAEYINVTDDTNLGNIQVQGPILVSSESSNLNILDTYKFSDHDGDQIPNGVDNDATKDDFINKTVKSGDLDGQNEKNELDFDDDGDGLPDILDPDNDNDILLDHMDLDDDNDGKYDRNTAYSDVNYLNDENLLYFASVYKMRPSSTVRNQHIFMLNILARIKDDASKSVTDISILGPPSLEDSVTAEGLTYDSMLYDDGKNGDGHSGDNLWGAQIQLPAGNNININDVLILTVYYSDQTHDNYLFMFNKVFENTLIVTINKTAPLQPIIMWEENILPNHLIGYKFQVLIYSALQKEQIFTSPLIEGNMAEYVVPLGVLESDKVYDVVVKAIAQSPIPGYEGDVIYSVGSELSTKISSLYY